MKVNSNTLIDKTIIGDTTWVYMAARGSGDNDPFVIELTLDFGRSVYQFKREFDGPVSKNAEQAMLFMTDRAAGSITAAEAKQLADEPDIDLDFMALALSEEIM